MGRRWYPVLCVVFAAGMVVQTWGQRWSGDYWAHRAAVLELSHDPWSPDHPFIGTDVADPNLSPYTLALGLAARVSPLGAGDVLSIAALANGVLFLVGLRHFVRRFSHAASAPFWALLATLFLWGLTPWRWSGYLNANSIGFGLPYPSMFATGLLLFAVAALIDFCDDGDRRRLAVVVVLAPVAVLSHPFTGAALAVAGLAVVVSRLGTMPVRRMAELTGGSVVAALAVLAWPLYPALDLLGASQRYDGVHFLLYRLVGSRTVLALFAVPALALRLQSHRRDPLALMVAGAAVIFAVGGVTGRYSLGRILPLGMLALHVAVGIWLAEWAPVLWHRGTRPERLVAVVAGGTLLAVGVFGCRAGLARAVPDVLLPSSVAGDPRLESGDGGLSFLRRETSPDDVMLAVGLEAARVAPGLGAKVVAPGYIAPFVDDVEQREADAAHFFGSASPDERMAILDRYGVSFVLFDSHFTPPDRVPDGTVIHRDRRYILLATGDDGPE